MVFDTAVTLDTGIVSDDPLRIYTGILGQIGDIIMFTATARRIKELFPRSTLTFAVSSRYREAGQLVEGLPYVDRLFVTGLYFERLPGPAYGPWHMGWPVDLRGDDEVAEQRRHDVVLETRPRHRRLRWWEFDHQVAECAHQVGVPGPIDLTTEIRIPTGTCLPPNAAGKVAIHNDPAIDGTKGWPWSYLEQLVKRIGPEQVVLLGGPGPPLPGAQDMRGRTTLAEAAAIIAASRCYIGIDSGLMWIAASLQAQAIGLYGTSYIPAYGAIQPSNPRAVYLQAEGTLDRIPVGAVLERYDQLTTSPSLSSPRPVVGRGGRG
jgi:glycosyl transferase family 9 (putative heptosyltransferase)